MTGTFGGVDFLHSVLGEATDHVTQSEVDQSEVDQMNAALNRAEQNQHDGSRSLGSNTSAAGLTDLLSQVPGTESLVREAHELQAASEAQAAQNQQPGGFDQSYAPYQNEYGTTRIGTGSNFNFQAPPSVDPQQVIAKIYPLFVFRDKVVRTIAGKHTAQTSPKPGTSATWRIY